MDAGGVTETAGLITLKRGSKAPSCKLFTQCSYWGLWGVIASGQLAHYQFGAPQEENSGSQFPLPSHSKDIGKCSSTGLAHHHSEAEEMGRDHSADESKCR